MRAQDGFQLVGIFCVARQGIAGGETSLMRSAMVDGTAPLWGPRVLPPGAAVVCNDRAVFHYTSPIEPAGHSVAEGAPPLPLPACTVRQQL